MDLVLRTTAVYVLLWIVTRGMGKRELAQMSPFELILLVTLGDLIQQAVTQEDRSVLGAVIAVLTMTVLIMAMSWLSYRSRRADQALVSIPVVVIHDGVLVDAAMKAEQVSFDELAGEARSQGIDDLARVRVGVLEPGGRFSFVLDDGPTRPMQTETGQTDF